MRINIVTLTHLFELIIFTIADVIMKKILLLVNMSDKFIEYIYE